MNAQLNPTIRIGRMNNHTKVNKKRKGAMKITLITVPITLRIFRRIN